MIRLLEGNCLEVMQRLSHESVNCCITSPPYFGLRDYNVVGQIGLEGSLDDYVNKLVEVFSHVWRILRKDGTLWLNLGDSYNAAGRKGHGTRVGYKQNTNRASAAGVDVVRASSSLLKPKELLGVPWRVAFALQKAGWYLRQDIIWAKPNPMPESVTDRCTKAHEYIFLFSKNARYYYNAGAILEPFSSPPKAAGGFSPEKASGPNYRGGHSQWENRRTKEQGHPNPDGRNKRSVWEVAVSSFTGGHFASYPPALIEPCVRAGCCAGGWILDPFAGAGTTGLVADRQGRNAVLVELNPGYVALAERRLYEDAPLSMEIVHD